MTVFKKMGLALFAWTLLITPGIALADQGSTVKAISARGELLCGVTTGKGTGFSTLDDKGEWNGMEVDLCRAIAAALLGDASKVKFAPLEFKSVIASLQSGAIDVAARQVTWTFTRDSEFNLDWAGIYLYDGQAFLASKAIGVDSALDLNGATVCVTSGSTNELNISDYFRSHEMKFAPIVGDSIEQNAANLEAGRCDVYTNDLSTLVSLKSTMAKPDDWVILPEVISKEPLGPVVRQEDPQFSDIVRWTLNVLIAAEELGVNTGNVATMAETSSNPEVQRLLGKSGEMGAKLGLANDWVVKVISSVGNYGEIFDRNLGKDSPIKMPRGASALWTDGGLLYPLPYR